MIIFANSICIYTQCPGICKDGENILCPAMFKAFGDFCFYLPWLFVPSAQQYAVRQLVKTIGDHHLHKREHKWEHLWTEKIDWNAALVLPFFLTEFHIPVFPEFTVIQHRALSVLSVSQAACSFRNKVCCKLISFHFLTKPPTFLSVKHCHAIKISLVDVGIKVLQFF